MRCITAQLMGSLKTETNCVTNIFPEFKLAFILVNFVFSFVVEDSANKLILCNRVGFSEIPVHLVPK